VPPPSESTPRRGRIAVIGGGPAGLRAAEVAARGGARVTVFDSRASVGRKFLVAGRSGLNLTHEESLEEFLARYVVDASARKNWSRIIKRFGPHDLREWARELGVPTIVSKGKVLPQPVNGKMRATPLLRNWLARLRELSVEFEVRQRWTGFAEDGQLTFEHAGTTTHHAAEATVLALGGGSWPGTGSDGSWQSVMESLGIRCRSLTASNCGWETPWPQSILDEVEGQPLKNIALSAGGVRTRGDLVVTRYGLEGPPIYRLGPILREMDSPSVDIDFAPDVDQARLLERMGRVQRGFVREARRRLNLGPAPAALLKYLPDRGPWRTAEELVCEIKSCSIQLTRPRPLAEAISSAGGLCWSELDEGLQLKQRPGVYAAGEMLDWDAPTGGYLLQGCFSTGDLAGSSALARYNCR
jgi:uncharacterized flavoprotein (TIGR03862 family)